MNGAEVGVLEEHNEVGVCGFLESGDSATLEVEIGLEVLSDFPYESLERKLPYEKLGVLLVLSDLPQCHRTWPETVRLLHAAGRRSGLACCFHGKLLS